MAYSTIEVQNAVEKLVLANVRRPYGSLGNRQLNVTFTDLQNAVGGLFTLFPNAPYYLVQLGISRAIESLYQEAAIAADLYQALNELLRFESPIEDISQIQNANVALQALSGALGNRTSPITEVSTSPAFKTFDSSVDAFLAQAGPNIKHQGQIVRTPTQARESVAPLVSNLKAAHMTTFEKATYLSNAIANYSTLNLPLVTAQYVTQNAQASVSGHYEDLKAQTPAERNRGLRDIVLDLLAAKATVKGFGSIGAPGAFLPSAGSGSPYSDADHPGTPATVSATINGPYPIVLGHNELDVFVDGEPYGTIPSASLSLSGGFVAQLKASFTQPATGYVFGDPPDVVATNDVLSFTLTGFPTVTVTFTHGARTLKQVLSEINAAIPAGTPLIADAFILQRKFLGPVILEDGGGFILGALNLAIVDWNFSYDIVSSDVLFVTDFTSLSYGAQATDIAVAGNELVADIFSQHFPSAGANKTIEIGQAGVRLRVTGQYDTGKVDARIQSIQESWVLKLESTSTAATTLGLTANGLSQSLASKASDIAEGVNTTSVGKGLVRATAVFNTLATTLSHTEPSVNTRLSFYKMRSTVTLGTGLSMVIVTPGALTAGVITGDTVIIRSTPTPGEVGIQGIVSAVTDTQFNVLFNAPVTAAAGVVIDVGADLALKPGYIAIINNTSPNDGRYTVKAQTTPLDYTMTSALTFPAAFGGVPYFFTDVQVGAYGITLASSNTGVSSQILVKRRSGGGPSSAEGLLFITEEASAVGATNYFQVTELPKGLEVNDVLELYDTNVSVPSSTYVIADFNSTLNILQLATPVASTHPATTFSTTSQLPFARIRRHKSSNYEGFKTAVLAWLHLSVNQSQYMSELDRLMNPILANSNPTPGAVTAAKGHLQKLIQVLSITGAQSFGASVDATLEDAYSSYTAQAIPQVNTLIATYTAKGTDRALDILIEGRFSEFFGLTQDTASYAGTLLAAVKQITLADIPVRKTLREQNKAMEKTMASYEDTDFEFDQSDIDPSAALVIPNS